MRHLRRGTRVLAALLCALMLVAAVPAPAVAVTQADIDALKKDASGLAQQKKELKNKISALSDDISDNMKKKELLDGQISVLSSEIANVEEQIRTYTDLITQTEAELLDAQQREEAQYELFCRRVRDMEERGNVSYWSVLFKANSFTDLLSRLDIVNEIMDADQKVIDDLQALQVEIEEKKTALEDQKTQSEAAKTELVAKKTELNVQRERANKLVQELRASQSEAQGDLDDLSAEEEAIQAEIVRLSKKLAEEQAAQGKPSNAALGGYIWPVSSRRITSTFGGRASPGGIGSTNHKGVDIGGVGYTSQIYAAKAGTVIVSQYSSSYGNYVVVSHGSGNTTLYAHMSSRKVSVGQYVNQGDVLGITGSTGNSTGPHLHFEITENGTRINPLKYLTGYVLAG
ncbi:murein hydrolase activator EnvC family protein [Dysosmobacter sp.]|uniref:murein hydrolase activator EnvC family protein n=1 Tax=Dysosmobacter sp. TaxID=2591382 RepID=UPI002A8EE7FC|nr:peptidoglycan DD-metalloendopeptidase family protein [Dysosmobacter sp.]MDY3985920.1 peptidoglycan DD-metalloendopeptidase family protein [Dysosmobacter sp.]